MSRTQAEKLRELNISFLDAAGNAYLKGKGLYVFISGCKKQKTDNEKPSGLFNAVGVKLLFGLLLEPGLDNASYRSIAEETNVPKTSVGRLIKDLEKTGYIIRRGKNQRHLTRKTELMKRWVEAYGERLRMKLNPVRFTSKKFEGRWWEDIDIAEYDAVWGGETGAAVLTKYLKPESATIYADSMLPKLQARYGLVRDKKGEIEILQKFWKKGEIDSVAPPLVVYADLLATADERNLEAAQIIYDQYLAQDKKGNS